MNDAEEDSDDVLSDVHLQLTQRDGVTTLCWEEEQTTKNECVVVDADGDLEPPRKRSKKAAVALAHRLATPVADVGLQVWRGALLLGDYFFEHPPVAVKLAELGAGVGAAGLLAATLGADVLATDGHAGAVALAAANGDRNAAAISRGGGRFAAAVLEWRAYADADADDDDALGDASLLVAADCVYDDVATDALFDAVATALDRRPGRELVLALEKRFNFEAESLSVRAHGYRRFAARLGGLDAERLPLPPRRLAYDRGDEAALELWRCRRRGERGAPPPD
jgi:hypothetical protein